MTASEPEAHADYTARKEELLARLDDARRAAGAVGQHRELLNDPEVSRLAYQLVEVNQPWIDACVRREKRNLGLRASHEELVSLALTGGGNADVHGVLGAILHYDVERFGTRSFTRYLGRAIHNALAPRPGHERPALSLSFPLPVRHGNPRAWADRHQRQPREIAIDAELLQILHEVIEKLPERNRDAATYILEYVQATGERPTGREVGQSRNPPVSKQAGETLMKQTMERLKEKIEQRHPQLAQQGVGGWEQFSAVFGIHKHHDAERGR
jgi:hypothetical protein